MSQRLSERVESTVRNILSGQNSCGTLVQAAQNGESAFFVEAVRPALAVYDQELEEMRQQRDAALKDAESKRFALETVVSRVTLPPGPVTEMVCRALPGHPFAAGA